MRFLLFGENSVLVCCLSVAIQREIKGKGKNNPATKSLLKQIHRFPFVEDLLGVIICVRIAIS